MADIHDTQVEEFLKDESVQKVLTSLKTRIQSYESVADLQKHRASYQDLLDFARDGLKKLSPEAKEYWTIKGYEITLSSGLEFIDEEIAHRNNK